MEIHISLSAGGTQPAWGDGSSASRPLFLKTLPKDDKSQMRALFSQSEDVLENADGATTSAMDTYVNGAYDMVNEGLRSGKMHRKLELVAPALMRLMKANAKMKPQKVWRGVKKPTIFHTLKKGAVVKERSFISTSFLIGNSLDFAAGAESDHGEHSYLLHIEVPANCPHFATDEQDEKELILPPGLFTIGKHYQYIVKAKGPYRTRIYHIVEVKYAPNAM